MERVKIDAFLCGARQGGADGHYLYTAFRKAYPALWKTHLQEFFETAGFVPLYELAASIAGKYELMRLFPDDAPYVMKLLELLKSFEDSPARGSDDFFDHFADGTGPEFFVAASGMDAVTLITIHKAKGLEFPVVIIPFVELGFALTKQGTPTDIVEGDDALSLIRLAKDHTAYSPELKRYYLDKKRKVYTDDLNTLYVALTRPAYELYLFVPAMAGRRANDIGMLIWDDAPLPKLPDLYSGIYVREGGARAAYEQLADEIAEAISAARPGARKIGGVTDKALKTDSAA